MQCNSSARGRNFKISNRLKFRAITEGISLLVTFTTSDIWNSFKLHRPKGSYSIEGILTYHYLIALNKKPAGTAGITKELL